MEKIKAFFFPIYHTSPSFSPVFFFAAAQSSALLLTNTWSRFPFSDDDRNTQNFSEKKVFQKSFALTRVSIGLEKFGLMSLKEQKLGLKASSSFL